MLSVSRSLVNKSWEPIIWWHFQLKEETNELCSCQGRDHCFTTETSFSQKLSRSTLFLFTSLKRELFCLQKKKNFLFSSALFVVFCLETRSERKEFPDGFFEWKEKKYKNAMMMWCVAFSFFLLYPTVQKWWWSNSQNCRSKRRWRMQNKGGAKVFSAHTHTQPAVLAISLSLWLWLVSPPVPQFWLVYASVEIGPSSFLVVPLRACVSHCHKFFHPFTSPFAMPIISTGVKLLPNYWHSRHFIIKNLPRESNRWVIVLTIIRFYGRHRSINCFLIIKYRCCRRVPHFFFACATVRKLHYIIANVSSN